MGHRRGRPRPPAEVGVAHRLAGAGRAVVAWVIALFLPTGWAGRSAACFRGGSSARPSRRSGSLSREASMLQRKGCTVLTPAGSACATRLARCSSTACYRRLWPSGWFLSLLYARPLVVYFRSGSRLLDRASVLLTILTAASSFSFFTADGLDRQAAENDNMRRGDVAPALRQTDELIAAARRATSSRGQWTTTGRRRRRSFTPTAREPAGLRHRPPELPRRARRAADGRRFRAQAPDRSARRADTAAGLCPAGRYGAGAARTGERPAQDPSRSRRGGREGKGIGGGAARGEPRRRRERPGPAGWPAGGARAARTSASWWTASPNSGSSSACSR